MMSLSGCGRPRPQCVLTRKINDLLMSINGEQKMLVGHIPPAFSVSQSGHCPLISSVLPTLFLLSQMLLRLCQAALWCAPPSGARGCGLVLAAQRGSRIL